MSQVLAVSILIIQFIAAMIALINYKNLKGTTEAYFVYFLIYVLVTELLGYFSYFLGIENNLFYNIYSLISIIFYLYWYSLIMPQYSKFLGYMGIMYMVVYIWDAYVFGMTSSLLEKPLIVGTLFVIVCTTLFFYNLLKSDRVEFFIQDRRFWFVTGMFIFYVSFLPLLVLTHFEDAFQTSFKVAITALNIILYTCFCIGILMGKKNETLNK